ncbi:hypothetical protein [Lutibacter profundi]|uniref:hypothetical protein n=1 Tax=Lutibacter profundi TaxID=1622118 RepID=UPI00130EBC82|nr:hypothetical protein [Lutibacter profundi]
MKKLENYGVQVMGTKELQNTNGGFLILGTLAAIAGIVYIAEEIAYIAGRQDSNCDK